MTEALIVLAIALISVGAGLVSYALLLRKRDLAASGRQRPF